MEKLLLPAVEGGVSTRKEYLVYGAPRIEDDEIELVLATLKSRWIGSGPNVQMFQEKFRNYKKVDNAIAVNSCTAGLHLSLLALGLKANDEILVPSMTFCATANVVEHIGAKPVLIDCNLENMNLSLEDIRRKVTRKTKAAILVHFAGRIVDDIEEISDFLKKKNIKIIEDCAHAIESELDSRKSGSFGDIASYSFYVTKNITTSEGGMITTNIDEYAEKVKIWALHGMSRDAWKRFSDDGYKHYEVVFPGYKYNMTDMQAALGLKQFEKLDKYRLKREEIWNKYNSSLSDLPVILPPQLRKNERHAYHLYTILLDNKKLKINRDEVLTCLHRENIGTGVHYRGIHLHKFYKEKYGFKESDFPNATKISNNTLSLPLSAALNDNDVNDVINALVKILKYYEK